MKSLFFCFLVWAFKTTLCSAQSQSLPIKCWEGSASKELVFYITGDGGLNKFSTALSTFINQQGYNICVLDARSYFWSRKTPQKAAADIASVITGKLPPGGGYRFSIAGYSFGADVLPFIVNNLPVSLKSQLKSVTLLSPSTTTDFQVHILDMLGAGKRRGMDVVAAISQMQSPKTVILFGSDEKDFPVDKLTPANDKVLLLPGGHHFEGNTREVAELIIANF